MNSHSNLNIIRKTVVVGGKEITLETGKLAKQAGGSVVISCGESSVLCTAVVDLAPSRFDFLPLTVNYMDKAGASGTIPGGFLKRETNRSERETLICRLIDRPVRPMFPKTFRNELQVIAGVLSYDKDNETDLLSLIGSSAALMLCEAPMEESVAGVRICKHDGAWHLNPSKAVVDAAEVNLAIAGTKTAITMVEGGGNECPESDILDALEVAQREIKAICEAIDALAAEAGKPKLEVVPEFEPDADVVAHVMANGSAAVAEAMKIKGKHERKDALKAARQTFIDGRQDRRGRGDPHHRQREGGLGQALQEGHARPGARHPHPPRRPQARRDPSDLV
jgi:polyribonucleotide nucleotidyltransferase